MILSNDSKQVWNWLYDNGINPCEWNDPKIAEYEAPDEVEAEAFLIGGDSTVHAGGVETHPIEVDDAWVDGVRVTVPDWLEYKLIEQAKKELV